MMVISYPSQATPLNALKPIKILVVEDEPNIRNLVGRSLVREGYEVNLAENGQVALAQLEQLPPDLVLLDLMLPDISGFELCQHIRSGSRYIPVVMLTALDDESVRDQGFKVGTDEFLTKPFSLRELSTRIAAVLNRC
jgi:DNA-binding response OmpR family regulator